MPRILYVPMYSSPARIATDSTFNWAKIFFKSIVENDPEAFVYLPVPEGVSNTYKAIDHPRIHLFPVPMYADRSQYSELIRLQEIFVERFTDALGPHFVDVVVCDKASVLPLLKAGIDMWLEPLQAPKVYVTKTHFILDSDKIATLSRDFEMTQSLGYAMADMVLWMSEEDYQRGSALSSKYLSATMTANLQKSKVLGGWLANFGLAEKYGIDPMDKPRSPITLSYAYASNADYHSAEIVKIFDTVYQTNPNVHILLTTSGGIGRSLTPLLCKMPYVEQYNGLPQEEFFKKIRDAHIFIYWPSAPGMPTSTVMELQNMGLVGVFLAGSKKPPTLFPDYPYLAKGPAELTVLVKYLSEHYFDDSVQEVIRKQKQWNLERYDPRKDAVVLYERILKILEEKKGDSVARSKSGFVDLLKEVTVGIPEFTMDQLLVMIKNLSRIGIDLHSLGSLPYMGTCMASLRRTMEQLGFRDACDGPEVRFVRVDK